MEKSSFHLVGSLMKGIWKELSTSTVGMSLNYSGNPIKILKNGWWLLATLKSIPNQEIEDAIARPSSFGSVQTATYTTVSLQMQELAASD
jgi:hypothetical protein